MNLKKTNINNILLIATHSSLSSGATWSLIYLADELKKNKKNPIVILPQPGDSEKLLKEKGIKYYILRHYNLDWIEVISSKPSRSLKNLAKRLFNIRANFLVKKIIVKDQIDLIHINASTDNFGANVKSKKSIKRVWHIREFLEEDLGKRFKDKEQALGLIGESDSIIAISNEIKKKYQDSWGDKIKVIYNGVDLEKFFTSHQILNSKKIVVTIAGRITESKGQDQLVKAVLQLMNSYDIRVNIIGNIQSKDYYKELQELIQNSDYSQNFKFINFTPDVADYFKQSDIVAVCSRKEAFGRVTVEAMAAGALVIAANTGGSLELIKNQETGFLYSEGEIDSLRDTLQEAIDNPEKSKKIALQGQTWSMNNFSYQENAKRILDLYKSLEAY